MDMNIDLSEVTLDPIEEGDDEFRRSLHAVLARIAPLLALPSGLQGEERVRRLGAAINTAVDALKEFTGMAHPQLLPDLIERVAELAVTGNNVEVQIGVAGDLRVDKRHHIVVDDVLLSLRRIPPGMRPAALRQGITTLQRLLALLLFHGWTDGLQDDEEARQAARRAIVETVQGRHYAGQLAL